MNDNDVDAPGHDPYIEALNASRLRKRIAAVTSRAVKLAPVQRADGAVMLRGRRRVDRTQDASDRRLRNRRRERPATNV